MMTKVKRLIVILLAASVLICSLAVNASALTETSAAEKGAEVFEAWNIISYSNYEYMVNEYVSPNRMFIDNLNKTSRWEDALMVWRVATFDGSSEVEIRTKEVAYYNTFLFNILYDESSNSVGTTFVSELASGAGDVEKSWKSISASTWKKLNEIDKTYTENKNMASIDLDEKVALLSKLKNIEDIKETVKLIGDSADYMSKCTTVLEFIEKCAKVEALLQNSKETAVILSDMKAQCTDNLVLQSVLEMYIELLEGGITPEMMWGIFAGATTVAEAGEDLAGKVWDSIVAKASLEGMILSAVQTVDKFTMDMLVNSGDIIASYYKIQAMCEFEDLVKSETLSCQRSFESNPTPATAKKFIAAYKLMAKTMLEGLTCSRDFVVAARGEGVVNEISNAINDAEYQEMLESIDSMKVSFRTTLDYIDTQSNNYYWDVMDYLNSVSSAPIVVVVDPLELTPVDAEPEVLLENIKIEVYEMSNHTYTKNTTLTEDLTTFGNLTVSGGTLNLNGHTLTIHGDFQLTGGALNLNGGTMIVHGNVYIDHDINLYKGLLDIDGNVLHSAGTITFDQGTLDISGDYRVQDTVTNSVGETSYTNSYGNLYMQYEEDFLRVGGKYYLWSHYGSTLAGGKIELYGGMEQVDCSGNYGGFDASGSHIVAFMGNAQQTVYCERKIVFANLEIDPDAKIIWTGLMNVTELQTDALITSDNMVIAGLHLNGHSLHIIGDISICGGSAFYTRDINLYKGLLEIKGNVLHSAGKITFDQGTLNITGDYRIQAIMTNSVGENYYTSSSGCLYMVYAEDSVSVMGDMVIQGNSNTLTAGTLRVAGDFTHISGSFSPSGTHTTVLNGTGDIQYITFPSSSYRFNILELTRDGSYYVFNPDNCWKTLKEEPSVTDIEVTNISLSARTKTLTVGEAYQLTATVSPENATNPSLTWSSSTPTVASVDENGLITALSEGTTTIRAEADNGLYRTCKVTVNEIFSGIMSVGTCMTLPGEEIAVPVTVWDNPGFAAMRLALSYDPALLTPIGVRNGEALPVGELSYEDNVGSCSVLWYHSEDIASDGVMFYLVFQVAETAKLNTETTIELQSKYGDICKADHTNVSFTNESGSLIIKSVLKGDIYEDEAVNVHDILVLQRYLTGLETLSGRQIVSADMDENSLVDMKDIVRLAQVLLGADTTASLLSTDNNTLNNNLIVYVENVICNEDGFADVPVAFSGCSGMAAIRLQVGYDASLIELVEINPEIEAIKENLCSNLSDENRDDTWITWYSANDQILDGTVITLRFKLLDEKFSGIIPVSVTCRNNDVCTARLDELPIETQHGIIHTQDYPSDVQIGNISWDNENGTYSLCGSVICSRALEDEESLLIVAFYDAYGRMTEVRMAPTQLSNEGQFVLNGIEKKYFTYKLFVLNGTAWEPLCPETSGF